MCESTWLDLNPASNVIHWVTWGRFHNSLGLWSHHLQNGIYTKHIYKVNGKIKWDNTCKVFRSHSINAGVDVYHTIIIVIISQLLWPSLLPEARSISTGSLVDWVYSPISPRCPQQLSLMHHHPISEHTEEKRTDSKLTKSPTKSSSCGSLCKYSLQHMPQMPEK